MSATLTIVIPQTLPDGTVIERAVINVSPGRIVENGEINERDAAFFFAAIRRLDPALFRVTATYPSVDPTLAVPLN